MDKIRHKTILINTFKAFIDFCQSNGIHYVAAYGTVLGAVRHGGIIPWDDDIDVFMDRREYNKFLSLRKNLIGTNYEIIDINNEGYYLPFAKFCDKNTSIVEVPEYPYVIGVFIDIFPLDFTDGDINSSVVRYHKLNKYYYRYKCTLQRLSFDNFVSHIKQKRFKSLLIFLFYKFLCQSPSLKTFVRKRYEELEEQYINLKGDFRFDYTAIKPRILPSNILTDTIDMAFETLIIKVPREYDSFLKILYGDWHQLPPENKRFTHPQYFIDLNQRLTIEEIQALKNNAK
ncbi:MAG: LicD family protein [Bacteroidales bacterium]|nr:LicD family protein [Bacteroidales bacterium]